MNKSSILLIVAFTVIGFGLAWYFKQPEIIYQTSSQQRQIDSLTSVIQNQRTTKSALTDSLKGTSKAFQEYIKKHRGEVASLTRIKGKLNLKIDSLKNENNTLSALTLLNDGNSDQVFKDTTITNSQTFGDSLLEAISNIRFKNDSLSNDLKINQLRNVKLDLAILVNDDRTVVESIATSPDFDSLKVKAQTTIKPPKRKIPWYVFTAGGALFVKLFIN